MHFEIRKLEANESKLYRALRLEALREYPEYFGSDYSQQVHLEKLYFERIIETNSDKGDMVGAFRDEVLIGICGVTYETEVISNAGEIVQMYVKRNFQGHMIGENLIRAIIELVKNKKKVSVLLLGVYINNVKAKSVYEKCEFTINEEIKKGGEVVYMTLQI